MSTPLHTASTMERRVKCPGSENLIRAIPRVDTERQNRSDGLLRQQGTRVHKARQTENVIDLSEEEIELYKSGLEYEQKQVEAFKQEFKVPEVVEGERELQLYLHDPTTMGVIGSGIIDVHYHTKDRRLAAISDWKVGFLNHLSAATTNWQLRFYAVLYWLENQETELVRVSLTKNRFPNAPLDYCDYTAANLKLSFDSILFHLWESKQPDAPRHPGYWCQYCPAKPYCKEAAAYALLPMVIAEETLVGEKPSEAVAKLTVNDLKMLWAEGSTIRGILEASTDRLKAMSDEELAEFGLAHGKGKELTPVTKTKEAYDFLAKTLNWSESDLWAAMSFSNEELTKIAMREKNLDKKSAVAWRKTALADYITPTTTEAPIVSLK